jgi:hypothetical protein
MKGWQVFRDTNSDVELESHADGLVAANQDLAHRARALLREDVDAEQKYRQLAEDLRDPSAGAVLGLLLRETRQRCELLRHIIDGTLDGRATGATAAAVDLSADSVRMRALCLEIQELARGRRRHAEQLRDLACAERGRGYALQGAILDTLARDSDKHGSLLLELACYLRAPRWPRP